MSNLCRYHIKSNIYDIIKPTVHVKDDMQYKVTMKESFDKDVGHHLAPLPTWTCISKQTLERQQNTQIFLMFNVVKGVKSHLQS